MQKSIISGHQEILIFSPNFPKMLKNIFSVVKKKSCTFYDLKSFLTPFRDDLSKKYVCDFFCFYAIRPKSCWNSENPTNSVAFKSILITYFGTFWDFYVFLDEF